MLSKLKNTYSSINYSAKKLNDLEKYIKEINWANVFNSSITGSVWLSGLSLNVGRMAANYSLLYILYRILNEVKPAAILELGLGETTKLFQEYLKNHNVNAYCMTVEHNQEWIDRKLKDGVKTEYIDILKLDIEEKLLEGNKTLAYKDFKKSLLENGKKFDLVLVDGPLGSQTFSRYNIVELVEGDLINNEFIIILDDFNREGEKQTFEKLKEAFGKKNIKYSSRVYSGVKDQVIVVSDNYKFLTTL